MRDQVIQITPRGSSGQQYAYRHSPEKIWLPLVAKNTLLAIFFVILLCIGAFYSTNIPNSYVFNSVSSFTPMKSVFSATTVDDNKMPFAPKNTVEFPLNCSVVDENMKTCPANYYPSKFVPNNTSTKSKGTCPEYFRYIHEDLLPWRKTGITEDMVSMASKTANFRLVILNGKAYVETYEKAFQTRDTFTLWGILQLLRKYPGQIPDLDLMFDCVDWPVIKKEDYDCPKPNSSNPIPGPPPLFRYCADDVTYDIVFPDWSFWGWAEINIKPWEHLSKDLKEGNKRINWTDREPYAYWKGNPNVAETRMDLLKCNVSDTQDWHAMIYVQDWVKEHEEGYKKSDLAKQCNHRYKIYIEGSAWSVSEKYILACDSVPLIVNPNYYDFFSRGLIPLQHYWPINVDDKCRSIKHAVDWGNSNTEQVTHELSH
ncbi:OLC1v1027411C1 [Oldenlandia corymbosa var. corymbosa]|uniref:OLC1v1027411C1 n=1 Tax=Oldenlandia corymbosa var. corymbosa TaxID=529605 RepID=A0AAV1CCM4_OLDCO|nr:OLC1v1027411C1 [Oldenlandia corymbosa var. corymbosa]